MRYKVQISKVWETEDKANLDEPVQLTGLQFNVVDTGETYNIFAPGHNLKKNEVRKAIKDHIKTLPERPELEGTTLDIDTDEEES